MTGRRLGSESERGSSVTDAALDALDAAELRGLIRDIIPFPRVPGSAEF